MYEEKHELHLASISGQMGNLLYLSCNEAKATAIIMSAEQQKGLA
jgi:hypothetical protein